MVEATVADMEAAPVAAETLSPSPKQKRLP